MNSTIMELIDAHDILRPGRTNEQTLKDFLNSLKEFHCLANCSPKQLQTFSSSVNNCLNSQSQKDKYHGLCALDLLLQQCSLDYIEQNIGSYINSVTNQVFKCQQMEPQTIIRACQVMAKIIEYAPTFPEISRQLSSLATTLITCMSDISIVNKDCVVGVLHCMSALMSNYPGACGAVPSNSKAIEAMLVRNMTTNDVILTKQVAKCYSLLPRLGGGGKDGINHIEAWISYCEKTANTIEYKILEIFNVLPHTKSHDDQRLKTKIEMQEDTYNNGDFLRKSYSLRTQINVLCRSYAELHSTPAPFVKNVRPGRVFKLLKVLSRTRITQLASGLGHENKVVLAVLPDVHVSVVRLVCDFLMFGREDLAVFVPDIFEYLVQVFGDIRQTGGIQLHEKAFSRLKMTMNKLVSIMCDIFGAGIGIEKYANDIIPYVISDFIPAQETVTLKTSGVTNGQSGKKAKKKVTSQGLAGQILSRASINKRTSASLVSSSLHALSSVLKASGSFISESCHKNLQACIVGTAFDVQRCSVQGRPAPFEDPECRSSLYETLFDLLSNSHPRWPVPFRYAYGIFRHGHLNDHDQQVRLICNKGLSLCESVTQPRSQALSWGTPISPEEIENIKEEMMKVHTIVITAHSDPSLQGIAQNTNDAHEVSNNSDTNDDFTDKANGSEDLTEDSNSCNNFVQEQTEDNEKPDRSNDFAYRLLSGRERLSPTKLLAHEKEYKAIEEQDEDIYIVPDASQREEIMKSVYNFDQEPVFIPDDVKNRSYKKRCDNSPPDSKKAKISATSTNSCGFETEDNPEEHVDLETMLGTFVDKLKDQ